MRMRRTLSWGFSGVVFVVSLCGLGVRAAVTSDIVINLPNGEGCYVKDSGGAAELPGPNIWVGSSDFVWTDQ
jgi:hypothetical protein